MPVMPAPATRTSVSSVRAIRFVEIAHLERRHVALAVEVALHIAHRNGAHRNLKRILVHAHRVAEIGNARFGGRQRVACQGGARMRRRRRPPKRPRRSRPSLSPPRNCGGSSHERSALPYPPPLVHAYRTPVRHRHYDGRRAKTGGETPQAEGETALTPAHPCRERGILEIAPPRKRAGKPHEALSPERGGPCRNDPRQGPPLERRRCKRETLEPFLCRTRTPARTRFGFSPNR